VLYLYDDATARQFQPFALTRPVSELRAGTDVIRARWEHVAGTRASGVIAAEHLADFDELDAPIVVGADTVIPAGAIVVNSRCVVSLYARLDADADTWECAGAVCAVRLDRDRPARAFDDGTLTLEMLARGSAAPLSGRWLHHVWDVLAQLTQQLTDDINVHSATVQSITHRGEILGTHTVVVEPDAIIEPHVVFDAHAGPIRVARNATVSSFTRIVGPCYVGEHATIVGDRIANCSIGDWAKIRGEISSSIVLGHSNKGHTGFVGHSYLGRWVNLGAGTTTSNLKNTYGTVQLWTPAGVQDTGQQFLGTLFGDHTKTGIGTMLNTGTVLSAGANVFGATMPPKYVPPFAWGDGEPYETFAPDKFVEVAERMMGRRHVLLSDKHRRFLTTVQDLHAGR